MMDRNETLQTSKSNRPQTNALIWGIPITAIQLDARELDAWFDTIDLDELCQEEFSYSACKTSNGLDANYEIDYTPINDIVYDHFSTSLDNLGPKMVLTSELEVPWINVYEEHGFQDAHDHQGTRCSDFSWCYVHESGDSHIVFKNRNSTNSDACMSEILDAYEAHIDFVPELTVKGTLYLFPSTIYHAVSPNKSTSPRITISGNIRVRPATTDALNMDNHS